MATMKQSISSHLLLIPPEIRLQIYNYLFPDNESKCLSIRHYLSKPPGIEEKKRTKYKIITPIQRQCIHTTYRLAGGSPPMHPQIMRTCRQLYEETSHFLYSRHTFDFSLDVEAVGPFLMDLSPGTRSMIPEIRVRKRAPNHFLQSDNVAWNGMCNVLAALEPGELQTLAIIVEGRRPRESYKGPQELSAGDFRLLSGLKHECLQWIPMLGAAGKSIRNVEVIPDVRETVFQPTCTESILFAAFSASFHDGFMRYLTEDLGVALRIC